MPSPPLPGTVLWPDPDAGPWAVTIHWRVQHGVPTPVGFSIVSWRTPDASSRARRLPKPDTKGALPKFEGRLLRSLPLTEILAATRLEAVTTADLQAVFRDAASHFAADEPAAATDRGVAADLRRAADILETETPRGGRYLGDEHYREVARVYAEALADGRPPTKAVAQHFTVEPSSAAKKVSRARELKLLPKTTRGKAGVLKEKP